MMMKLKRFYTEKILLPTVYHLGLFIGSLVTFTQWLVEITSSKQGDDKAN
ncbi:hypothetical protein [Vibrio mediterranei]